MRYDKLRMKIYFVVVTLLLLDLAFEKLWEGIAIMAGFLVFGLLIILFPNQFYGGNNETDVNFSKKDCLVYYGDELDLSENDMRNILDRHSIFYTMLDDTGKQKFIKRLCHFIEEKTFKIHDKSGFREMPVLISASAIQVSFGLEKYQLPHFTYIHIHPAEFLGMHPTIRFLEGNVSGNSINISWKYFLEGFKFPQDGKNVGLHEMAHAYYYQNFGPCESKEQDFINTFNKFNECGNNIFTSIQDMDPCLYSNYAKKNFQEFWAESVELFFEKPMEVRTTYPVLYESISDLLKQDPTSRPTQM